jgi:hypothetical protein
MPNNTTRGIPGWMFDESICAGIRSADRPTIDCPALIRLAQLLDLHLENRVLKNMSLQSRGQKLPANFVIVS